MTHGRGRTNKARNKQRGGMKFAYAVKKYFIEHGIKYNDLNVMNLLIENVTDIRIVWDASRYSFIFELTIPGFLIDQHGLSVKQSEDTHAAFAAVAAGASELGTRVSTFCAKISFVYDGKYSLDKTYKSVKKDTVSSAKANKEADTQRMLFEEFACLSTTAPFVPDVLAHAILTGPQFNAMFAKLLSPPATSSMFASALSTFTSTKKDGVLGTPNEIYKWIMDWCAREQTLMIDVIFMEMMDFGRTAPSAPRSTPFQMIVNLRSHQHEHQLAALRMMANIASVRGKGIMPHDFHEGNGMATDDGLQLYLIDWGGIWNLSIPEDRAKVLHDFGRVCERAFTTSAEEAANEMKITAGSSDNEKRVARFPSIEDLCGFFQLNMLPTRKENVKVLKDMFQEDLDNVVDFTCVEPTEQNVHHALMMVAFVDYMSNRMNFDDYPNCQCGSVLKVVYPEQLKPIKTSTGVTVTAFDDFRTFLKTFAVVDFHSNTRLQDVVDLIKENVKLCSSVCSAITVDKLRATSWIDDATKAEARRLAEEARKVAADAKARLADEAKARLVEEARLAEEAKARLAEEAKATTGRLMEQAEKKRTDAENASKTRLRDLPIAAKTKSTASASGVAKSKTESKPELKQKAQVAAKAQEAPVSTSWLARVSSWFKKKGGTRKHKKRNNATRRRHH